MRGPHLPPAPGSNQKKTFQTGFLQKALDQAQCRRIGPLQIIERQHDRMLGGG